MSLLIAVLISPAATWGAEPDVLIIACAKDEKNVLAVITPKFGNYPLYRKMTAWIKDGRNWALGFTCFEEGRYDVYQKAKILTYLREKVQDGQTTYELVRLENVTENNIIFDAKGPERIDIVPHGQYTPCNEDNSPPSAPEGLFIGF